MDDDDEGVAVSVIESLSSREISEPRVMDAYMRALKRTGSLFDEPAHSAVKALGKLGPRAIMARSALQHMATSDDISETLKDDVRMALKRIQSFNP